MSGTRDSWIDFDTQCCRCASGDDLGFYDGMRWLCYDCAAVIYPQRPPRFPALGEFMAIERVQP